MDDTADVVEREFGGLVTATLIAVSRVPPRPNLTCASRVQIDREGFSPRIKMEIRIAAPLGGHGPIGDFETLQDPTELLMLSVEDPGAVTRFQDDGVHDITMVPSAESQR
jgi:hypothetical protein